MATEAIVKSPAVGANGTNHGHVVNRGAWKRPARAVVEQAIRDAGGNLSQTALRLGCSRPSLYTWIYQLDLVKLAGVGLKATPAVVEVGDNAVLNVKLPADLHRWVRIHAIQTDRSATAVFTEALGLLRAVAEGQAEA